jgi:formylmethanofuran dehydrogenase subunit E
VAALVRSRLMFQVKFVADSRPQPRRISQHPFLPCDECREIIASGQPPPVSSTPFSKFSPLRFGAEPA